MGCGSSSEKGTDDSSPGSEATRTSEVKEKSRSQPQVATAQDEPPNTGTALPPKIVNASAVLHAGAAILSSEKTTPGQSLLVVGPVGAVYNVPIPAGVTPGTRFEFQLPTLPPAGLELVASTKWYISRKGSSGYTAWDGPKSIKELRAANANSASRCCRQSDFAASEPVALDRVHTLSSVLATASAQGVANLRTRLPAAPVSLIQALLSENDFDVSRTYAVLCERMAQGQAEAVTGTTSASPDERPQFVSRRSGRFIFLSSDTGDAAACEWDEEVVARAVAAAAEAEAKAAEAKAEALKA